MRRLLASALLLLGTGAASAELQHLVFNGEPRSYHLRLPARPPTGPPPPLVIVLHGAGGSGAQVLEQGGWLQHARARGFALLAPDGLLAQADAPPHLLRNPRSWNAGPGSGTPAERRQTDDIGFIEHLIQRLLKAGQVDERRVYVTGFSNGAAMAFRLAAERPQLLAAVAPVANALLVPPPLAPPPLLLIWGKADPLNPMAGGRLRRGEDWVQRPSAEASWRAWAQAAGCSLVASTQSLTPSVTRTTPLHCPPGTGADLVRVKDLGHQWPGGRAYAERLAGPGSDALDATPLILDFFDRTVRQR